MSKDKKEILTNLAEKFTFLDEESKNFVAGYMAGKQEEKAKWEQKLKTA